VPAKEKSPKDKAKAERAWSDRQKQLDDKLAKTKALRGGPISFRLERGSF